MCSAVGISVTGIRNIMPGILMLKTEATGNSITCTPDQNLILIAFNSNNITDTSKGKISITAGGKCRVTCGKSIGEGISCTLPLHACGDAHINTLVP